MEQTLKLARLMRYARSRANSPLEANAGKWLHVFHLTIHLLRKVVDGEIAPERLAPLDKFFELYALNERNDGSSGSGNWGHEGRPGKLGGSAPGGGVAHRTGSKESGYSSAAKERAKAKAEAKKSGVSGMGGSGGGQSGSTEGSRRYATKEEYLEAQAKAESVYKRRVNELRQETDLKRAAIDKEYESIPAQMKAVKSDKTLSRKEKKLKLAELDERIRERNAKQTAITGEHMEAMDKAKEDLALVFSPEYEYRKINGEQELWQISSRSTVNPERLGRNCQRCAIAVEMRQRGYDVCASYGESGHLAKLSRIERNFVGAQKVSFDAPNFEDLSPKIRQQMLDWGEGSRCLINFCYKIGASNVGHIYNLCVKDGEVFRLDGQSGLAVSASQSPKFTRDGTYQVTLIRTDKAKLKRDVSEYVREVGG